MSNGVAYLTSYILLCRFCACFWYQWLWFRVILKSIVIPRKSIRSIVTGWKWWSASLELLGIFCLFSRVFFFIFSFLHFSSFSIFCFFQFFLLFSIFKIRSFSFLCFHFCRLFLPFSIISYFFIHFSLFVPIFKAI